MTAPPAAPKEGSLREPMETAPAMELPPQASDQLGEERRADHALDSPLVRRRAQRAGA